MKTKMPLPPPIAITGGLIYPYDEEFLSKFERDDRYGESYSLARVVTMGANTRILVPRNMPHQPSANDRRVDGADYQFHSSFVPRDQRQEQFVNDLVALLKDGNNFVAEAATGFGKTWCAVEAIARIGKRAIVVVTKEDLRDQWAAAIKTLLGLDFDNGLGLIQGDVCKVANCGIVIAMIQTLSKDGKIDPSTLSPFGLCIWDECHRVAADQFSQSAYRVLAKLRLGLSATPDRKDGKVAVIEAHIGPVMLRESMALLTPRIIARRSTWKVPMVPRVDKKTGQKVIVPLPHSAGRMAPIIKLLSNYHERNLMLANFIGAAYRKDRKTLVLSEHLEHLDMLMGLVGSYGVPPTAVSMYVGGMNTAQKEAAKKARVIFATYRMTSEGTDIPTLDTLVMASPRSDVQQIVGRILRLCDKKEPVVFDILDPSSSVLAGFWKARLSYYASIGATVEQD